MVSAVIEVESTLTDRYQTTIPETVRKALQLSKRDKIHYVIHANGNVLITRAENEKEDPTVEAFLSFLAKDIREHPQNIHALNNDLCKRIQSLVSGVEVDLNESLSDENE